MFILNFYDNIKEDFSNLAQHLFALEPLDLIEANYITLIAIIILLVQNLRYNAKNIFTIWFYYIIGTFLHELSHAVVSKCLNGKPVSFVVFPKKVEDGWILGSVGSTNLTWYNTTFISLAPALLIPLAFMWEIYYFHFIDLSWTSVAIFYFGLINIITSAIPSSVDFRLASRSILSIMLFILMIGVIAVVGYAILKSL